MRWKINSGTGHNAAAGIAGIALGSAQSMGAISPMPDFPDETQWTSPSIEQETEVIYEQDEKTETSNETIIVDRLSVDQWEDDSERRFEALARKEALGSITGGELKELEFLTKERRDARQARSGEEVIAAYQRSRHISQMVEALEQYVEFEKRTHQPG
jgi:hypothetical protein